MKKHKYDDNLILLGDENDNICLMLYNYFDVLIHNKDIFDNFTKSTIKGDLIDCTYKIQINKKMTLEVKVQYSTIKNFKLFIYKESKNSNIFDMCSIFPKIYTFESTIENNKVTYVYVNKNFSLRILEENIQKAIKESLENLNKKENKNNMDISDMLNIGKPETNKDLNIALVNFMKAKQERLKEFHIKIEYFNEEDANCIMDWNKEDCQKVINGLHGVYAARKKFESSNICVFCIKNSYIISSTMCENFNCASCEYKQHHGKCGVGESTWTKLQEAVDIGEVFNIAWFVEVYIKYIAPHVSNEKDYEKEVDACIKKLTLFNSVVNIQSLFNEFNKKYNVLSIHCNKNDVYALKMHDGVRYTIEHRFYSKEELKDLLIKLLKDEK